jgi:KilA-N domain.
MELKRALELQTEYRGVAGVIHCNDNFICLNDLNSFFPGKRLDNWMRLESAKEIIEAVSEYLGCEVIKKTRGRNGGTFAHELIAMDFAAWLSVEFKIKVYQAYINGTQRKQDWNLKRILAANGYKVLCDAVNDAHDPAMGYHFSNEALMINEIVFGVREGTARDNATEEQLDAVTMLESDNSTMIKLGMDYQTRKIKLGEMYKNMATKKIIATTNKSIGDI